MLLALGSEHKRHVLRDHNTSSHTFHVANQQNTICHWEAQNVRRILVKILRLIAFSDSLVILKVLLMCISVDI